LYRYGDDSPRVLHLAWNRSLQDEKHESLGEHWGPVAWIEPAIPKRAITGMVAVCRLAASRRATNELPYSFRFKDTKIDPGRAELVFGAGETGLTCATFVLAMFAGHGISLVKTDTWVSRDDDSAWQKEIVSLMVRLAAPAADIQNARHDIGCVRYRPEEVAGSCSVRILPATFEEAKAAAREISEMFRRHANGQNPLGTSRS
jgi:hypothetical protein